MRLDNKVAIVTGAGKGIGQAAVLLFASEGAQVVIADVDVESGEQTAHQITQAMGKAIFVPADVSHAEDVQRLVHKTVQAYGKLDILYNNAGVWLPEDGPATILREEVWDTVVDINLKSAYLCCKYAIPEMVKNNYGSIINVTSIAAFRVGKDNILAYAASKGGIVSLTRFTAVEYGRQGIRANAICPGSISTPMTAESYKDEWVRDFWVNSTALGRVGTSKEVAYVALFLASDESSYVTGTVLTVDGGYLAK